MPSSLHFVAGIAAASALGLLASKKTGSQLSANCKSVDNSNVGDGVKNTVQKWNYNWDKMESVKDKDGSSSKGDKSEGSVDTKSTATRTLVLVRHGQYVWDPHDPEKRILTKLGKKQADITGQRLKELGYNYSTIHYSTMPRATETSNIIRDHLPNVPARFCDLMREGAPVRPVPMSKNWKPEPVEFFRDGPRIEAAFRKYFHRAPPSQKEDSVELLVCHANVIRYFVCRALQLPPEAWLRFSLAHASITVVVCKPSGTVSLKTLGGYEHIPPELVTFS